MSEQRWVESLINPGPSECPHPLADAAWRIAHVLWLIDTPSYSRGGPWLAEAGWLIREERRTHQSGKPSEERRVAPPGVTGERLLWWALVQISLAAVNFLPELRLFYLRGAEAALREYWKERQ